MARRFWTADGRFHGETSYEAAIGGNRNIAENQTYYFYGNDVSSLINGINFKGKWGAGTKRAGSDREWLKTYDSLPTKIKQNSTTTGVPRPAAIPVVNTMQSGSTIRAPASAQALASYTPTSCYTRMLKSGMAGGDVTWVQQRFTMSPTGLFDQLTINAVKNFQKLNGLTQDGIVGPKTACKLGMTCLNCGTAPTGGGTTGGGGTSPTSSPTPTPTPIPPKPEPPYKLPQYVPAVSEVTNYNPVSTSDLWWAEWGVFNAYELALVSHNEYFETLQPDYNVIRNMAAVLAGTDEKQFLIDDQAITEFATPDITQDLAMLAFGTAQPVVDSNSSVLYTAVRNELEDLTKKARLFGVKFLHDLISINIDNKGPYMISYISKRISQQSSYATAPIKLTATASQSNISLTWTTNPAAHGYDLYRKSHNTTIYTPPQFVDTFTPTQYSWTSPALGPNTTETFIVRAFLIDTDDLGVQTKVIIGESNEAGATTPNTGPSALAPLTYLNAVNGKLIARFGMPTPTDYFSHVYFTWKEGADPTSLYDGNVVGPFYAGSAGANIELLNIGTGYRASDRVFYVRTWTFNTAGQQTPGSNGWYSWFIRNPVYVDHIDVDSWRMSDNGSCVMSRWEPGYARMRVSNYGSSSLSSCGTVTLKYTGLWFYGPNLQNALGGRTAVQTKILVRRKDGGSAGAVHMYIGNHNYQYHPSTEAEPAISNVATTPETIARNTAMWVDLSRFNSLITSGSIVGFGMYRRVGGTVINDTEMFVGQHDAAGNALADDGRIECWHSDFSA